MKLFTILSCSIIILIVQTSYSSGEIACQSKNNPYQFIVATDESGCNEWKTTYIIKKPGMHLSSHDVIVKYAVEGNNLIISASISDQTLCSPHLPRLPSFSQHYLRIGYKAYRGNGYNGYYKLHQPKNWFEANRICQSEGAHLAIINSIEEARILHLIFNAIEKTDDGLKEQFWVGFSDLAQEGHYITIFGEALEVTGFSKWAPYQPDNYGGKEDCGTLRPDIVLNDFNCQSHLFFICEKEVS